MPFAPSSVLYPNGTFLSTLNFLHVTGQARTKSQFVVFLLGLLRGETGNGRHLASHNVAKWAFDPKVDYMERLNTVLYH